MLSNSTIVVAIIAAVASVLAASIGAAVSISTARKARVAGEELELLRGWLTREQVEKTAERADKSAELSARRDYEYDARKRLYEEIEPLLFQLYEALEEAQYRVRSLARTSRMNRMDWLEKPGYYLRSTLYKLLVPAVLLRLIQRRMTFVDLRVDESIRIRYQLLKLYSRSFTDDFEFAKLQPALDYDPNQKQWRELRAKEPAVYMRQGLVLGDLENICEAIIVRDANDRERPMTFNEFEKLLMKPHGNEDVEELLTWFTGFSPQGRPVLARILIAQAVMAQLLLWSFAKDTAVANLQSQLESIVVSKNANELLAWEMEKDSNDLKVALEYWKERLRSLNARASLIEPEG